MTEESHPSSSGVVSYFHSWNGRRHRVGIPLTEDEARERNDTGVQFWAELPPLPGGWHPVLVAVVDDTIAIRFFDTHGRQTLTHHFKRDSSREGQYFLKDVTQWTYGDDNPDARLGDAVEIDSFSFRPDGIASHTNRSKRTKEETTRRCTDVPVNDLWIPTPSFGDYAEIAQAHWLRRGAGGVETSHG